MNLPEEITDFFLEHPDCSPEMKEDRDMLIAALSYTLRKRGIGDAGAATTKLASCGHDPMYCGCGRGG